MTEPLPPITGLVAPGFEPVGEVFAASFANDEELGAGFCAIRDGEVIVDLRGGWADQRKTKPWSEETIVPVYSVSKAISALVLASIIHKFDDGYDTLISDIWPAFGANGKDTITLGQLVSHQAGLTGFVDEVDPDIWLDPPACAAALAGIAPIWPPGTAHGYHPQTWGYLVGEIFQRVEGRSLGSVLAEVFTGPEGIDFRIGTPDSLAPRIGEMMRPRAVPKLGELNPATRAAFMTRWAAAKRSDDTWRQVEIPSANGHGNARAVATLFGIYAHGGVLNGRRVIAEDNFEALITPRVIGQDLVLPYITEFAAGVMRNNIGIYGPNPNTLCHSGWGGSMGLGDPDEGVSAAYVMSRQSHYLQGDPRARRLVDALYSCL